MNWLYIILLVCVIIGPFDALYLYIKAERRKEAGKRKERESGRKK